MNTPSYFGGKSSAGHFQQLINLIPPHSVYIELFGGKLGIFRHKKRAIRTFVIEQDESLSDYYDQLGMIRVEKYEELSSKIYLSFFVESSYQIYGENDNGRSYYFIGDTFDFLKSHGRIFNNRTNLFIYLDPPYPLKSRKSETNKYKYELTDEQHLQLLDFVKNVGKTKIAISTYPNELYSESLDGCPNFHLHEINAPTRRGHVVEHLWTNYPSPQALHDYQYLGKDAQERETIRRKHQRWIKKLDKMPPLEQKAIINALLSFQQSAAAATKLPKGF